MNNLELIFKEESYKIIGACMEVHNELGKGFSEIVYKDALEIEFQLQGIPYSREIMFDVFYKGHLLPRKYCADFVAYDKIILEAKAISYLDSGNFKQTLNYLAVTKIKLGLLVNFGEDKLKYQRILL